MTRSRAALFVSAALVLIAACVDAPVAPNRGVAATASPAALHIPALLGCTPMTADSASSAIGTAGGTINVGPHSLWIPAGALDSTVTITAIAPSDTINRVILLPSGLTFEKKVWLTMSYANCGVVSGLLPHRIAYIDSSLSILDLLLSIDWFWTDEVSAPLEHFSDYAIAW